VTAPARARSRGFALIIVLWFLVLISAIGIYLVLNARSQTAMAHNIRAAADAEALADDGIARAAFNQLDPIAANRWRFDGSVHRLSLPAGEVAIRVADETQKINPNLASANLLAGLFEASGIDSTRALHLGAAVADWVSADGPPRPMGAKLAQYRAAGKSYGPPNAPLETLDDLVLVLGMTPDTLARVRPYLTIYTQSGQPNAEGAPRIILQALALAAQLPDDGAGSDANTPADPNTPPGAGPPVDPNTPSPNPPGAPNTAVSAAQPGQPQTGPEDQRVVAVEATGKSRDGGVYVRIAVLRLTPTNPQGYDVLDWERGALPFESAKVSD
jgi:general secretion pathway protein K